MTPSEGPVGVMLPGVDPTVGEIVTTAFQANPTAPVGAVVAALVRQAPEEIAAEVAGACLELLLCREKGELRWLATEAQAILVGIREVRGTSTLAFGTEAKWPMAALLTGSPRSVVVRMSDGARRVWVASEPLNGVVVRQSEAVALGNAMIESFGGRIIEDRMGPETMRQSFIEGRMTARAKARAEALSAVERVHVDKRTQPRADHFRIALAEAYPGTLMPGDRLQPENATEPVYLVERRVNDSWVLAVADQPPPAGRVTEPIAWVKPDGAAGPFGADGPPHWAFSETVHGQADDITRGETAPERGDPAAGG